ncbi:MAG: histidine phosphatase family protein [Methanomassiliicoccales archaeon]|nr:MAG: histidine phosphatase family protein [Methanomassiliicoccales archaeon]
MSVICLKEVSRAVARTRRAAILIRHAERYHIHSIKGSMGIGLTEKGLKDAYAMGTELPSGLPVNFFHSPALRCRQTVEEMARAFVENNGRVGALKMEATLCGPYIRDERCLQEAERTRDKFLRRWFDGDLDPSWIYDKVASSLFVLGPIISRMVSGPPHLDIHVSHDWEIVLLRETLIGLKHEDHGWVDYLDGLIFEPNGNGYKVTFGKRSARFLVKDGNMIIGRGFCSDAGIM